MSKLSVMTRASFEDKIAGKRLPSIIIEKLKANNVQHLYELTTLPKISNEIEMSLNPIQVSKFRKLVSEDCDDCTPEMQRESILIEREQLASRNDLELQLEIEKSTVQCIITLLLDDGAPATVGAKRRLQMSKAAHQNRANRLKSLIMTKDKFTTPISDAVTISHHSEKEHKHLSWRCPEIEGQCAACEFFRYHYHLNGLSRFADQTRLGINDFAHQFTRTFNNFFERTNRSIKHAAQTKDSSVTSSEKELSELVPEDTPEPPISDTEEICLEPDTSPMSENSKSEPLLSFISGASVLHQHLPSTALLQYDWHGQLVHRLARICKEVRAFNEQDETIRLESEFLNEERQAMRLIPLSDWHTYRAVYHSCEQRFHDIYAARREQFNALNHLFDAVRDWRNDSTEFNLFLRSNPDLDQSRYISFVKVRSVTHAPRGEHEHEHDASNESRSYMTVFVACPACELVHPQDSVDYRVLVLSALTRL